MIHRRMLDSRSLEFGGRAVTGYRPMTLAQLLGGAELERAFTALGERLASRDVITGVFVVDGAAVTAFKPIQARVRSALVSG
jgi:hypothetical protein